MSVSSFPTSYTDTPAAVDAVRRAQFEAERLRKLAEVRARTAEQKAVLQARTAARRAATRAALAPTGVTGGGFGLAPSATTTLDQYFKSDIVIFDWWQYYVPPRMKRQPYPSRRA